MAKIAFKHGSVHATPTRPDVTNAKRIVASQVAMLRGTSPFSVVSNTSTVENCGDGMTMVNGKCEKTKVVNDASVVTAPGGGSVATDASQPAGPSPSDVANKESYPWNSCIADNEKKYGAESAKRICGSIRAKYGNAKKDCKICPDVIKNEIANAFAQLSNTKDVDAVVNAIDYSTLTHNARIANAAKKSKKDRPAWDTDKDATVCDDCEGTGWDGEDECEACDGDGWVDDDGDDDNVGNGVLLGGSPVDRLVNAWTDEARAASIEARKGGLPHFTKWSQHAGGTSAAEGKHGYTIRSGQAGPDNTFGTGKQYSIQPISSEVNGRHLGYQATVFPSNAGGHAWVDAQGSENSFPRVGTTHRSPHDAWKALSAHHNAQFEGDKGVANTSSYSDLVRQARVSNAGTTTKSTVVANATDVYARADEYLKNAKPLPKELEAELDDAIKRDFVNNAGTSEGVRKSWLVRKHGAVTPEESQSLSAFDVNMAPDINRAVREGTLPTPEIASHIRNLDSAIAKASFRGGPMTRILRVEDPKAFVDQLAKDGTYTTKGYEMASTKPGWDWPGNVKMHIDAAPGSKVLELRGHSPMSKTEQGVIFPRSASFKVVSATHDPQTNSAVVHLRYGK